MLSWELICCWFFLNTVYYHFFFIKQTQTHTLQTHSPSLCCQKLSGRSKWVNVFDGILCFLHLPHRLALTWKSFHWNELDTGVHLKQEWIFGGVQQIAVWVWLVCVPGLFLSPFYYNLGAQLSVQSSTQNHIVIWMRVNVKYQHWFTFAFSLSSTRSSRYVVSLSLIMSPLH